MRRAPGQWALRGIVPVSLMAMLVVTWAAPPRPALAGIVVTKAGGSISIDVPPTDPPTVDHRDFTATVPGSDTIDFTETFSGGTGRVTYDVKQPKANALSADLGARIRTSGQAEFGSSRFAMEFTSDRPLRFHFTATPEQSDFFGANLDDIVADAAIDALGNVSGTIPHDEGGTFSQFVRDGTLPAGSHRFSIEAGAHSSRSGGGFGAGVASLSVTVVPLPPAAWTGLSALGILATAQAFRRRHSAHR